MGFPKLKYARLCRILTYIVVIGGALVPIIGICSLNIPIIIKGFVSIGIGVSFCAYLFRYFIVLMLMDMALALESCRRTARKQYFLSRGRTASRIRRSTQHFGKEYHSLTLPQPQPSGLRYKFSCPMTVYSQGVERIIATYETDYLDKQTYHSLISSGKANSHALEGQVKAAFGDKHQKKASLHRVTVILILAKRIDPKLFPIMYDLVCKGAGDEWENCTLPCVIDLEQGTCVFNSLRIPFTGYGYPVKNRGIRMIRKYVFGGNLNLKKSRSFLEPIKDIDPESSLWAFWRKAKHECVDVKQETQQLFQTLSEQESRVIDDSLYLKWDHRGLMQETKTDHETKLVQVEDVSMWYYPKVQPISKKTILEIKNHITDYYTSQGYKVNFVEPEDLFE